MRVHGRAQEYPTPLLSELFMEDLETLSKRTSPQIATSHGGLRNFVLEYPSPLLELFMEDFWKLHTHTHTHKLELLMEDFV